MLPNFVFSDEKKLGVQQHVNTQNDHVWSCDGEVGPCLVTGRQEVALVMVWAVVTESGRSPWIFVEQSVKIKKLLKRHS